MLGCASPGAGAGGARTSTHVFAEGLLCHVDHPGTGEPSGPGSTIVAAISAEGRSLGPIDRLTNPSRRLTLDDTNLIEGLRRALPGIRAGETRRIEIPWRFAYGESGRPPIPPREDLVFTVTCTYIVPAGEQGSGGSDR